MTTTLIILIAYLAVLLGLGIWSGLRSRGTSSDYTVASHSIGPVLLLLSLFGTTMTAFALVGSTGKAFGSGVGVYGMLATAGGIVHSACFFLIGVKLWKHGKQFGFATQIQYFRDRLQNQHIGLLLFPVIVALLVPYMLIGLLGGGLTVQGITGNSFVEQGWFADYGHGVPAWLTGLVISLVVLTYVFFGGMRGTAWANAMQTAFFAVLGIVTFVVIADKYGQGDTILQSMTNLSEAVADSDKAALLSKSPIPWSKYAAFLLIPLSVAMFPHVFQHWLTARSAKTFKLAIVGHPLMVLVVWMPCVLIGVWATTDLANVGEIPPNAVLGKMVDGLNYEVLEGLLAAGILAAIMSSLDSQFLAVGTMFTNDIVVHYIGEDRLSDKTRVIVARLFVLLVVAVTYVIFLFALKHAAGVFSMAEWCFSGFTGLFPIVFLCLYWRRFTAAGAAASILVTAIAWSVLFWRADLGGNTSYVFPETALGVGDVTLLPGLHPIVTITLASTLAAVLVSLVTKPPGQDAINKYFPRA